MADVQEITAEELDDGVISPSWWRSGLRMARRKPLATTGAVIVLILVLPLVGFILWLIFGPKARNAVA